MTTEMIVLFILVGTLLLISAPIFVALGFSGLIVTLVFIDAPLLITVQRFVGGIDKFVLMALPLFIFAADVMDTGGLSKRILSWCRALVQHVAGGLGMTVQVASMFFGALSGSSPATVAAIGKVMYPEMVRSQYPKSFTLGLITSSGSVALLIPPSITMIVYGSTMGVSVGALFMAGITAGLFYGVIFMLYVYIFAKKHKLPKAPRSSFSEVMKETKSAAWSLLVPVIILGGIYSGVFTPTEAAGIAAIYAILIGVFVYKEINMKKLYQVAISSAATSAQVMVLIAAASSFLWVLTVLQVPQILSEILANNVHAGWTFLIFLNLLLLVVGMFLDPTAGVIIIAPLIVGTAYAFGIDPVHLGLIFVTNLTIGMFTPPFGMNIFVAQGITGLQMTQIVKGLIPFILLSLVALAFITYIPAISTWLPNLLYGK